MSDTLTLAELQALCDEHERLLRAQAPDGKLAVDVEGELAGLPPTSVHAAVGRLALLKHVYRVEWEKKQAREKPVQTAEAQEAASALLRREPERVRLSSGRVVMITGRSYAAMLELAAHQNRIELLKRDLDYVAARYAKALRGGLRIWRARRREARRLERLYRSVATEVLRHRERIYANALTPTGAAAKPDEPAPAWWREATPEDDVRILTALYQVGPARYARMGPPKEAPKSEEDRESWGYAGLLASWGVRKKVDPAGMFNADLGQQIAEMRVSAPPALEMA